jgi:hypothetical protein
MYKTVQARFKTSEQLKAEKVGLEEDQKWELRPIKVNLNNICYIEEYDGMCMLVFPGDDYVVTNIPFNKSDYFEQKELILTQN